MSAACLAPEYHLSMAISQEDIFNVSLRYRFHVKSF